MLSEVNNPRRRELAACQIQATSIGLLLTTVPVLSATGPFLRLIPSLRAGPSADRESGKWRAWLRCYYRQFEGRDRVFCLAK